MTKNDLARVLAERKHISVKNAKMVVDMTFDIMVETLIRGQKIEIRGFGSFAIREYKAYTGRNPRSGDLTYVQEKKKPFFKVGKELKNRLNARTTKDV